MQRKGNVISRKSQAEKLVSVGCDMGGTLWATSLNFWNEGKISYHKLKTDADGTKEEKLYKKVSELIAGGYKVHVYYEAGRYGFAPARILQNLGAEVTILPVNKLEIIVCGKKVKTDRIDSKFLAGLHPEDDIPSVYIPTVKEEGCRSAERETKRLKQSINRLNAQLIAIIEKSEIPTPAGHQLSSEWKNDVVKWNRTKEWRTLPELEQFRLKNLIDELEMYEKHFSDWEAVIKKFQEKYKKEAAAKGEVTVLDKLSQFTGIKDTIARHLDWEIGDFKRFKNARSFSSYFGLTPTARSSGTMNREQGISKAGRSSLRRMAIQFAWLFYHNQKECELVKKYLPKLKEKGRSAKTAITAMARQLMVAVWRYIVHNEEIKGAVMNKPLAAVN